MMNRATAIDLLEKIVNEVDYDIYKSIFVEDSMEEPELAYKQQERLLEILGRYIEIRE